MFSKLLFFIQLCFVCTFCNSLTAQIKQSSLDSFVQKKKDYNEKSKIGYRVLLYNGNEKKAIEIYKQFKLDFSNIEVKLTYVSPNWKVLTQSYSTMLQAESVSLRIKEKYPQAKTL